LQHVDRVANVPEWDFWLAIAERKEVPPEVIGIAVVDDENAPRSQGVVDILNDLERVEAVLQNVDDDNQVE
jgi:hypothetical protein